MNELKYILGIGFWMVLAFQTIAQSAKKQAPGYLGYHTLASIDLSAAPAIAYGMEEALWGPNVRLGINLEQVLSRKFSLGVSAYGLQSRVRYGFRQPWDLEGLARVSGIAAGLSFKFYTFRRRGNIAPIGPYHKVETMLMRYWVDDIDGMYPNATDPHLGTFNDLAVIYTLGTQRILHKRITYNLGLQIGTLASIFTSDFSNSAEPRKLGGARIIRHLSMTLNAGVGVLVF